MSYSFFPGGGWFWLSERSANESCTRLDALTSQFNKWALTWRRAKWTLSRPIICKTVNLKGGVLHFQYSTLRRKAEWSDTWTRQRALRLTKVFPFYAVLLFFFIVKKWRKRKKWLLKFTWCAWDTIISALRPKQQVNHFLRPVVQNVYLYSFCHIFWTDFF